jgi:hypothetical protein
VKTSRRFWAVTIGALVALGIFHVFVVAPTAAEAASEAHKLKNLAKERAGYFAKDGRPVDEAAEQLEARKAELAAVTKEIERVKLLVPPELQPAQGRDKLYVQQQTAALGAQAAADGIRFADRVKDLGFVTDVPAEGLEEILARIAVARRFYAAAKNADVRLVLSAENQPARVRSQPDASVEIEELVYKVVVAADERGLARLLQELSRPAHFLALKELAVGIGDASSGTFEATLAVAGVRVRSVSPQADRLTTEAAGNGTTVPVTRPRRY